eukprot:SAG31_NODE_370_length_16651_cov_3.511056_8_plen_167_part_00
MHVTHAGGACGRRHHLETCFLRPRSRLDADPPGVAAMRRALATLATLAILPSICMAAAETTCSPQDGKLSDQQAGEAVEGAPSLLERLLPPWLTAAGPIEQPQPHSEHAPRQGAAASTVELSLLATVALLILPALLSSILREQPPPPLHKVSRAIGPAARGYSVLR